MSWTQTLIIISSIIVSTAAVWHLVKKDIKRYDADLQKMRHEFKSSREKSAEELSNSPPRNERRS